MDYKNILLYSILKGFKATALKLGVAEEFLYAKHKLEVSMNTVFFERIIEIIKSCVETMGIETAAGYFNLTQEMIQVLVSPEAENKFLESVKPRISEELNKFTLPPIQFNPVRTISSELEKQLVVNTQRSIPSSQQKQPTRHLPQPVPAFNPPSLTPSITPSTAFNPLEPPNVLRILNPANLQEHTPIRGTITSPDYSYNIH